MGRSTAEVTIERSADEVWAAIRDYGDPRWRGGIDSCVREGDVRVVHTSGVVVEETELHRDEAARTFSYGVTGMTGATTFDLGDGRVVDLSTMVGHHRATMTVVPLGDEAARVVYDLELDEGHDQTLAASSRQYQAVIERLKACLEG